MNGHDDLAEFLQRPSLQEANGRLGETITALRALQDGPAPVANEALRLFLNEKRVSVLLTEKGDLSATAASNVHGSAPLQTSELPKRRRTMITNLVGALASKLASLGVAAQVGLGTVVAAASVTGAGAAGVLPPPVQNAVAGAVAAITPFHLPSDASKGPPNAPRNDVRNTPGVAGNPGSTAPPADHPTDGATTAVTSPGGVATTPDPTSAQGTVAPGSGSGTGSATGGSGGGGTSTYGSGSGTGSATGGSGGGGSSTYGSGSGTGSATSGSGSGSSTYGSGTVTPTATPYDSGAPAPYSSGAPAPSSAPTTTSSAPSTAPSPVMSASPTSAPTSATTSTAPTSTTTSAPGTTSGW